jgi:hypothetical protein
MNSLSGKIKKLGEKQRAYIGIIESNLNDIVSPFVHGLSSKLIKLSPTELQVSNLIKQGNTTKEIAEITLEPTCHPFHNMGLYPILYPQSSHLVYSKYLSKVRPKFPLILGLIFTLKFVLIILASNEVFLF